MRLTRLLPPAALVAAALLASCAAVPSADAPARRGAVVAVTRSQQLLQFDAGEPGRIRSARPLRGLQPGEAVLALDVRPAKGWLYALGSTNRLYRLNPLTATATPVGAPLTLPLSGNAFGAAFDPATDRLHIVSDSGQNLRVDPDTGDVLGLPRMPTVRRGDTPLDYVGGDAHAGQRPGVVAVAHAPTSPDVLFVLDAAAGSLAELGHATAPPASGHLRTVGPLGAPPFADAAFDVVPGGSAFAALGDGGDTASRWVELDLRTGTARVLGTVGVDEPVVAMAIAP